MAVSDAVCTAGVTVTAKPPDATAASQEPEASQDAQASSSPRETEGKQGAALPSQPPGTLDAAGQNPEIFFENYLRVLIQLVTCPEIEAWRTTWSLQLHAGFASVYPTGLVVPGDDTVLSEWRMALHCGQFNTIWLSELALDRTGQGSVVCSATLVRSYTRQQKQNTSPPLDVKREMLRLQVTAVVCEGGMLRVAKHSYQECSPKVIGGVSSHSQIGQDLWVLNLFKDVPAGFFVEVGANHAEELSNSYLLEKGVGWKGICVEPFPSGDWDARGAELVKVAVGPDGGKCQFVAPGHVLGGFVSQVDLLRVARDVPQEQQQVVEVETRTMATILRQSRPGGSPVPRVIHYLSLDTEGSEYEILCAFPFDVHTVLSITVEHNYREPTRSQIRQLLESKGFKLDVSVEHDDYFLLANYEKYL